MFGWSFRASDLAQAEHFYSGEPEGERVCAPFDLGLKSKILGHLHGAICHRCHQNDKQIWSKSDLERIWASFWVP